MVELVYHQEAGAGRGELGKAGQVLDDGDAGGAAQRHHGGVAARAPALVDRRAAFGRQIQSCVPIETATALALTDWIIKHRSKWRKSRQATASS